MPGFAQVLWSTHFGGKVLQRVALNSVDAQLRIGLDNGKASGHYPIVPIVSQPFKISSPAAFLKSMRFASEVRSRTEKLLGATGLLVDLNQTGLQLLNGWNVVGENTHLSGLGGDVDLDTIDKGNAISTIITMPRAGRGSRQTQQTYTSVDL